jgi:8-oxo-dGTP diphosphatase
MARNRRGSSPSPESECPVAVRRGAKALISSSDRVFLVAERHADRSPFWTLPGGGVHSHESLSGGLRRELNEELCCRCLVADPAGSYWYAHSSLEATVSVYTVFECTLLSGVSPDPDEGVLDARWVDPADPPPATLPQVRQVLRDADTTGETTATDATIPTGTAPTGRVDR